MDLMNTAAVRERCKMIFDAANAGKTKHFSVDLSQLPELTRYVLKITRGNYPDFTKIPYHSRWQHFEAGGNDRVGLWRNSQVALTPLERGRQQFEVAIVSVLLDAGAGNLWKYLESGTNKHFTRSEGLAIASWHMYMQGFFAINERDNPRYVDPQTLKNLDEAKLARGMQVRDSNPLVGLPGRLQLLKSLGDAMTKTPQYFMTSDKQLRLGGFFDYCVRLAGPTRRIEAAGVLKAVLEAFGDIWPGRLQLRGKNLGDVWRHSAVKVAGDTDQLVPFHKLSQWLSYSLLEPLEWFGIKVEHLDGLTGLPEYRNGGLLIDMGLLIPKENDALEKTYQPSDEFIVEWRALTVICLDLLGADARQQLRVSPEEFPLAKILQGGTWAAGRAIAAEKRDGGAPPVKIDSDGTVF